jgi:outer membrane receptor protein involved in Fe transport
VDRPYVPRFLNTTSPLVPPSVRTDENAFTYLLTPRFKISPDLMVYARFASGYRPGGPNSNSNVNPVPTFDSDTTRNYELGLKGSLFDHTLAFEGSVYYIDWQDMQLQYRDPPTRLLIFANASRAKSQGVELSLESRPLKGLAIGGWAAWNEAELTEPLPPSRGGGTVPIGAEGDRLPVGSRFSGSLWVDQQFPLGGGYVGSVGAAVNYVGNRLGNFVTTGTRQRFPAYAQTDVHAGLAYESWSLNLFVNNVTDRRGLLLGGAANPAAYYVIPPRTAGLSLLKTF